MKKIFSMILALTMILAIAATMGISIAAAPEGTAINSAADFAAMAADGKYYLNADITLDATYEAEFTGTFDGNGKTVTITKGAMFNTVNNATISNFTVNGDITTADAGVAVGNEDFAAAVTILANGTSTFKNITSNVNFTTTSSNTRYGAIAATSAVDYNITLENCVNNGDITVVKYAGGVYGWSAKLGIGHFKGCVNNGDIYAEGYAGGIINRLANKGGDQIRVFIENCVNTGNVTGSYCGGIYAYGNAFVSIIGCVNSGDITAVSGGSTGGIVANLDDVGSDSAANHIIKNNINYGNVTNTTAVKNTGGIVGYIYGRANCYGIVDGNVNYGTVSSPGYCSQILAYTNSNSTIVTNNVGAGKVVGGNDNTAVFVGLSSARIEQYTISGNYYIENDGTKMYSYSDADSNAVNRVALADKPAGTVTFVADLATADVVNALNTAIGSTAFEIKEGKIALVCNHDAYLEIDGACSACGYTEPVVVPPVDEPSKPTGDNAWVYVLVAAIAVLGTAVVAKRREN